MLEVKMMRLFKLFQLVCLVFSCVFGGAAWATATDWGVIPVGQETTISFASYDITKNFTDQYSFSLQAGTDTSYAVTVTFDVCRYGCGNPSLSYGLYDASGQLVSNTGTAVLTSGDYYFQVKGTGMGAGNSVDYNGSISFMVSAVPEPSDVILMIVGLFSLVWAIKRRRHLHHWTATSHLCVA
jgi:hypothetical protein